MCKEIEGSAKILRPHHIVSNVFGGYAGPGGVHCLWANVLKDVSGKLSNTITNIPGPLAVMNKKGR
jgi:hypothetical protein